MQYLSSIYIGILYATIYARPASACSDLCRQKCPMFQSKVCGTNGQTYRNICDLNNAICTNPALSLAHEGACIESISCHQKCDGMYSPVCGSDGNTYENECELAKSQCKNPELTQVSIGECPRKCTDNCPEIYQPVCGTDGVTYDNKCNLEVEVACRNIPITIQYDGTCIGGDDNNLNCQSMMCMMDFDPVCGSDGVTYSNRCELDVASCKDNNIKYISLGECQPPENSSVGSTPDCKDKICPVNYDPVCGTNGKTYNNMCYLNTAKCNESRGISLASKGACPAVAPNNCQLLCPLYVEQVCGSNGFTYSNECFFQIDQCYDPALKMISKGPCPVVKFCDWMCPVVYEPVCASNGRTYSNPCYFENAQCRDESLKIIQIGECCDNTGTACVS